MLIESTFINRWFFPNSQPQPVDERNLHRFVPVPAQIQPGQAWQRFKDFFLRPTSLHVSLRSIANNDEKLNEFDTLSQNLLIQGLLSNEFPNLKSHIIKIFQKISPENTSRVLTKIFEESIIADSQKKFPLSFEKLMQRLLDVLSLSKIESGATSLHPNFINARKAVDDMVNIIGEIHAVKTEESIETLKQTLVLFTINTFEWIIDSFLMAFQLNDLTEDAEYPKEAQYRLQLIISMFSAYGTLLASLTVMTGSVATSALILLLTSSFLAAILTIYFKWLKPAPANNPPCVNYTNEAIKGNLKPVHGRDFEVNTILQLLCSNIGRTRKHSMVIGKSGVGKNEVMKEVAIRIAKGDVPAQLKKLKVQYVNCSDLASGSVWDKMGNLARILKKSRKYEKETLFIFDEVHVLFKGVTSSILAEKFKTLLDPGPGGLPFCIAATTPEEFDQYIKTNLPFVRRFEKIPVESMQKKQALLVLSQFLYEEAPEVHISATELEKMFDKTVEKFPNQVQPFKTLSLLSKSISRTRDVRSPESTKKLQELKDDRKYLSLNYIRGNGMELSLDTPEGLKIKERIADLDKKIKDEQQIVDEENNKLDQYDYVTEKLQVTKQNLFNTVVRIKKLPPNDLKLDATLKNFLLSQLYLNPGLQKTFEKYKNDYLDSSLDIVEEFDKVIEEELAEIKKEEDEAQAAD